MHIEHTPPMPLIHLETCVKHRIFILSTPYMTSVERTLLSLIYLMSLVRHWLLHLSLFGTAIRRTLRCRLRRPLYTLSFQKCRWHVLLSSILPEQHILLLFGTFYGVTHALLFCDSFTIAVEGTLLRSILTRNRLKSTEKN